MRQENMRNPSLQLEAAATLLFLFLHWPAIEAGSFSKTFGGGDKLQEGGVISGFDVAANDITSCSVTCTSGTRTSLFIKYGGAASVVNNDAADFSLDDCSVSLSILSDTAQTELGWSLSTSAAFEGMAISCSTSTPGGTGDDPDGAGFGCFSESATVHVLNKGLVSMKDLQIGDMVLTAETNQYQPIYAFGHYLPEEEKEFLQIYTEANPTMPLEITRDHMIFVPKQGKDMAIRADSLRVGDQLIAGATTNQLDTITNISSILKRGMYMPLTPDGTIIVNHLKASNYISYENSIPRVMANSAYFGIESEQTIQHWWMSPYRMLCMGVTSKFCKNNYNNHDDRGILKWEVLAIDSVNFAEQQNFFVQVFVMGIPIFTAFAILNLVEVLIGPRLAPSLITLLAIGLMWICRRRTTRMGIPKDISTSKKQL